MNNKIFVNTITTQCIHMVRRRVRRRSASPVIGGRPIDPRPDLRLMLCNFPLSSDGPMQCRPHAGRGKCPHGGPYGVN